MGVELLLSCLSSSRKSQGPVYLLLMTLQQPQWLVLLRDTDAYLQGSQLLQIHCLQCCAQRIEAMLSASDSLHDDDHSNSRRVNGDNDGDVNDGGWLCQLC